jgi:endonuclease YncB( thermonuclease family)
MRATLSSILLLASLSLFADTIHEGKVIKIADGDTLTILVDQEQLKIRLSEIDTPERKQWDGLLLPLTASECQTGSAVTSQKREGVRDEDYAHWC